MRYGGRLERKPAGVPVADLAGLDAARRLARGGWRSVRPFLVADPREVALRSGIPEEQVRALQEAGGLRRVPGLGPRGVECLVAVGIDTVELLAASEPGHLQARLADRLGSEAPPVAVVRRWVVGAKART